MTIPDFQIFQQLLEDVHQKAFGFPLEKLTETKAKLLSNAIFEQTDLMVGAKSLVNFSKAVMSDTAHTINPSLATLDTLARYVLNAPLDQEAKRKEEANYRYWYEYGGLRRNGDNNKLEPLLQIEASQNPIAQTLLASKKKKRLLLLAFPILLLFIFAICWIYFPENRLLVENFNFKTIEDLEKSGWRILDRNDSLLKTQDKFGYLKLYTLRGDYWNTPPDTPAIENLFIHRITCKNCDIIVKIVNFNPVEDYQQAGFFLLDSKLTRNNNLRMTYAYWFRGMSDPVSPDEQKFEVVYREHGYTEEYAEFELSPTRDSIMRDSIYMKMKIRNKLVTFFKHTKDEYGSYDEMEFAEVSLNFKPAYIALAAFRGIRNSKRNLNTAAAIPAYIDYVRVIPVK